ncbi:MAG: 30S ribosome-binding factor RbfA [Candidatus Omnitrophica bacterium]|nr:30S ribosome-binding factor RbfA [Candidatus Omnitrophota bacterium]
MAYQRAERVGRLIQQNLSKIIQSKLEDPRIGLVTITRVKVSKDLSYATIFITAENDRVSKKSLKILLSARRFIRKRLAEVLRLRKIPEISFKLDERIEELQRINELFEKIKK